MVAAPCHAVEDGGGKVLISPHGYTSVEIPKDADPAKKYKLVEVKPTIKQRIANAASATKNGAKKSVRAAYVHTKKFCVKSKPIVEWAGSVSQILIYFTGKK